MATLYEKSAKIKRGFNTQFNSDDWQISPYLTKH